MRIGAQFTSFTSTKVQILIRLRPEGGAPHTLIFSHTLFFVPVKQVKQANCIPADVVSERVCDRGAVKQVKTASQLRVKQVNCVPADVVSERVSDRGALSRPATHVHLLAQSVYLRVLREQTKKRCIIWRKFNY